MAHMLIFEVQSTFYCLLLLLMVVCGVQCERKADDPPALAKPILFGLVGGSTFFRNRGLGNSQKAASEELTSLHARTQLWGELRPV